MPKTQEQAFGHASNKKPYHAKNHVEKGDTLIYALGGLGEVGKNMYCATAQLIYLSHFGSNAKNDNFPFFFCSDM